MDTLPRLLKMGPKKQVLIDDASGHVLLQPQFVASYDADYLMHEFVSSLPWQERTITLFGKRVLQPRLICWMGDNESEYQYSNTHCVPEPWHESLNDLRLQLEGALHSPFNSVLANYYRSGDDSMGLHRDNEKELGNAPVIASLSLGGTRRFVMKHGVEKERTVSVELHSGDLLIMSGQTQSHWYHGIPKTKRQVQPRINLTFRYIVSDARSR